MRSSLEIAEQEQRKASDPAVSTFVSASAGTGKTKLLTDRILRLLLAGTPARKILCLTYTKAAAAEMAIRLNSRLGAWVVMPEPELAAELSKLDVTVTAKTLRLARQLLAQILDLPGGMRIGTIHAFCQSLLRRFPLEARLSPHFEVEDETEMARQLREAREDTLSDPEKSDAISAVAEETNEIEFAKTVTRYAQDGDIQYLAQTASADWIGQMQRAALGLGETQTAAAMADVADLRGCFLRIAELGTPSGKIWATKCLDWLALDPQGQLERLSDWLALHFTSTFRRRDVKRCLGKKLNAEADLLMVPIEVERDRLEQIIEAEKAERLYAFNENFAALAWPINQLHRAGKTEQSRLSYADLIATTVELLNQPEQVAWVLYKLDEGIDHLLLDEVQDTAPAQWKITDALAFEFFNGAGARDVRRTIFAVGDDKQSIFSFQGADLDSFGATRNRFRRLAEDAGRTWHNGELSVSFRSTAPILSLVDAVFAEGAACQGVCAPGGSTHRLSRVGQAGQVSLWPLARAVEAEPAADWDVPADYVRQKSAKAILALKIAKHIQEEIQTKRPLPSRARAVSAGDFLILVRQRDDLVAEITRACKACDIPVAGLDRMVLTEQQAVSDLLALCDSMLLPSDDFAFAQYLVSPLGGLSDESLMELAMGRQGSLAAALFARRHERDDWEAANEFFQTLRRQVDFVSPFSLLAFALGPLGGRTKLLRRLGAEAAEPIDELMAEAQAYAQMHPASLQQFLFDLRQSGATIKREPEGAGDVVRIMTVHGAKGLQAPIVILPDTTGIPRHSENLFWLEAMGGGKVPVLCPHAALRSRAVAEAAMVAKDAQMAEYNRLLYVALTRAEDELIVCGAEPKRAMSEACWYQSVRLGFGRLHVPEDAQGVRHFAIPQSSAPDRVVKRAERMEGALPVWAGAAPDWRAVPPLIETRRPEPLAPSRSADEKEKAGLAASPLGGARSGGRAAALAKGKIIHTLLQYLPALPASDRRAAARHYLAQTGFELGPASQAEIARMVMGLIESDELQALFGPGSRAEVPLAGIVGEAEIGGLVDRLVVDDSLVMLADFKTDRSPASVLADVPVAYLKQMAAYAALLKQIFPDKSVSCQLIWTETAVCMAIPPEILAAHAPSPAQPFANMAHA